MRYQVHHSLVSAKLKYVTRIAIVFCAIVTVGCGLQNTSVEAVKSEETPTKTDTKPVDLLKPHFELVNSASYWVERELPLKAIGDYQRKARHSPKLCPELLNVFASRDLKFDARVLTPSSRGKLVAYNQNEPFIVYVYLHDKPPAELVKSLRIRAATTDRSILVTALNFDGIQRLAGFKEVRAICLPILAFPQQVGAVTTEGVTESFAAQLHVVGIDGTGRTVVVIDNSFDLENQEIIDNVSIQEARIFDEIGACAADDLLCGEQPGNSHGTAVAEIVADMAPGVRIIPFLAKGVVGFENAVQAAIERGDVDVITSSLAFPSLPPLIGLRPEQGPAYHLGGESPQAKALTRAVRSRIAVTQAVGNSGEAGWSGAYRVSDIAPGDLGLAEHQSLMEFRPEELGRQKVCLPIVYETRVAITYNGPNFTNQDYDIYLFDADVQSPTGYESATHADDFMNNLVMPFEIIAGAASALPGAVDQDGDGNVEYRGCLVVASFSSTEDHLLHFFGEIDKQRYPDHVNFGSLLSPADARLIMPVGAVFHQTNELSPSSSLGPTDDGRLAPRVCASTGVSSSQYPQFNNQFFGTSAATPHVAGAAALVKQQLPFMRGFQIEGWLAQTIIHDESYSQPNLCTSGLVALFTTRSIFDVQRVANCPAAPAPGVNWAGCNVWEHNPDRALTSFFDLRGVDLSRASLIGANLEGANLTGANLSGANLAGARLSYARLDGANLSNADLSFTSMDGVNMFRANLTDANLSYAYLFDVDLSESTFVNANLRGAWFQFASLWGANLTGADFSEAEFFDLVQTEDAILACQGHEICQ